MATDPSEIPLYVSPSSGKSLWQEYRVFSDRIELGAWIVMRTLVIPAGDIVSVDVISGLSISGFVRRGGLAGLFALKLDWADMFKHVMLRRRSGLFRCLRFTPDNPERFAEACRSIMQDH